MWHATPDTWHVTRYVTQDTWHVSRTMWRMVRGEHSLKISAPQLLQIGIKSVLKILNKRMTKWMNDLINETQRCL